MNNINKKDIKLKDWISVDGRDAVVCNIYENESNKIEVIYLDRDRSIIEDVQFKDGKWSFIFNDPCGGYADNISHLAEYVSILRSGRRC